MFPVAVVAGAGWLFLFVALLIIPPSPGPHEGGGQGEGRTAGRGRTGRPDPGDVPPAVVSLLARRLDWSGFGATLVDLAARGWFEVRVPAGPAGPTGPGGPALCVIPAETPGGPLIPFERRVVAHVALRAGARGEVPAPALSDGFGGGETEFMSGFRAEVDAEARRLVVKGDSDSEDEYHVAIDDGTRDKAWDLSVGTERYRRLPPGTFAHARVNLRSRADVTVEPVEPPAVAHPLARVAADQLRAVTNGLPDPADLVLETEAAAILGGKVRGSHLDGAPGRTMVWQATQHGAPHAAGRSAARGGRAAGAAHRQARTRRSGRLPGQPGRHGNGLGADRAQQHPRLGTHRVRGIAGRAAARRGGATPRTRQKD
jgi:hypothetical protein